MPGFETFTTTKSGSAPGRCDGRLLAARSRRLVGGNDELRVVLAAHAVDGAGGASTNGVGVATGMLGDDRDGAISPSLSLVRKRGSRLPEPSERVAQRRIEEDT
jgi:hypothetical protein